MPYDRAEFLKGYASRILGRPLTDDEAELVSKETSRGVVRGLCATFPVVEEKPKKKGRKPKVETPDEQLESVISEIESSSSKGTE